jgi:hypothetical protein
MTKTAIVSGAPRDRRSRLGAGQCRDRARGVCRVPADGLAGAGDRGAAARTGLPARLVVPSHHSSRSPLFKLTGDDRERKTFGRK